MLPPPHGHNPAMARTSVLLPVPELAGHQQPLAGFDCHFRFPHHRRAVIERHRQILQAENNVAVGFTALDAADAVAALGTLEAVERHHQGSDWRAQAFQSASRG